MDDDLRFWGVVTAFIVLLLILCMWMASVSCHKQWAHSSYRSEWGAISGCLIEVEKDKWIPEDNYRELDQ